MSIHSLLVGAWLVSSGLSRLMAIFIYTSSERASERIGDDYPPCCGKPPLVLTWRRHKDDIVLMCQNPACENRIGVLDHIVDIRKKWDKYRIQGPREEEKEHASYTNNYTGYV